MEEEYCLDCEIPVIPDEEGDCSMCHVRCEFCKTKYWLVEFGIVYCNGCKEITCLVCVCNNGSLCKDCDNI